MRRIGVVSIVGISIFLISCAVNPPEEWHDIIEDKEPNIQLRLEGVTLNRTKARGYKNSLRWSEIGVWRDSSNTGQIRAFISVLALFHRVFVSTHRTPLHESIQELSGSGYVTLKERGSYKTLTGIVDYQFYNVSGLMCFYVENFWSDPSMRGVDSLRNAKLGEYIIGNALLRAYFCEEQEDELELSDLEWFLEGVNVQNVYWPDERFKNIGNL